MGRSQVWPRSVRRPILRNPHQHPIEYNLGLPGNPQMDNIRGTSARLRRTFQYPADDSSNDSPDILDEEG